MEIKLTEQEARALLELKKFIRQCATPPDVFLNWIADRLVKNGDNEQVDFVQKLRDYASLFFKLRELLGD